MTETLFPYPAPRIAIGTDVLAELTRDLVYLRIEECNSGLTHAEARFVAFGPRQGSDRDELLYLDGSRFDFGSDISIEIGGGGDQSLTFDGVVSAIKAEFEEGHEPEVMLCAEDKLMELRLTRRTHAYNDKTDAEIVEEIADFHSMDADAQSDGPSYDVVQQWNMSDLAFLRDRARRVQADVWVSDNTLHFVSRGRRDGSEITLVQGNHLIALRACADLAHQRSEVRVCGYDAAERAVIDEPADAETIRDEAPDGRTGPDILSEVFSGDRISYRLRDVPLNNDEARQWARNEMLRRARSFVTVNGTTRGTPQMSVGSLLRLERVGPPFEGAGYYVVEVAHSYDLARGYRTEFTAERAAIGVES